MIDKEKIEELRNFLKLLKKTGQKRNIYNNVFALLEEDLIELKEKGMSYKAIAIYLSSILKEEIKERTLISYFNKLKKGVKNKEKKDTLNKKEKVETETETINNDEKVLNNFLEKTKKLTK